MADEEQLERLKQDVEAWNEWRKNNHTVKIDFTEADLNGANLSKTDLSGADFSWADLRWADLSGADLSWADFRWADLRWADLSGADLRWANLRWANLNAADLSRIQALDTNFMGALLTGACIEDWNINSETKLDGVECDYIYLKDDKQERRPSDPSRNFEPGEFSKLFQEARNTLNLILHNGLNWRAFAFAFNETNTEVIDEYGDRLFLRGYELLGDGMVKLKIRYCFLEWSAASNPSFSNGSSSADRYGTSGGLSSQRRFLRGRDSASG